MNSARVRFWWWGLAMNAFSPASLRQCNDSVTRIDFVRAIGPATESPARSWVASVTTDVLARTAAGVAAKAAEPASRPMATTRAFNRRLLGITELLAGRGYARLRVANTRRTIRHAYSPPGGALAAKPCLKPCKQHTGRCVSGLPGRRPHTSEPRQRKQLSTIGHAATQQGVQRADSHRAAAVHQ